MKIIDLGKENSILQQFLAEIRDVKVQGDPLRFRRNLERIGEVMAYEISKSLAYREEEIQTPMTKTKVKMLDEQVVLGTILRAGLPFHQGFLDIFDRVENFFMAAYRKHTKGNAFEIALEYVSGPELEGKVLIMTDPMLATARSMEKAIRQMIDTHGMPKAIHIVAVIATQQGVKHVEEKLADLPCTVWTAAIDPGMDEHAYIVPGLGDAGDLAYGGKV